MAEFFLVSSSLTLFSLGCVAISLSILFRSISSKLDDLPRDLAADARDKTFIVFDPSSERRKSLHSSLSLLPIVAFSVSVGFAILAWKMLESGLALSLAILAIGLNLIEVDDASEIYHNSKTFSKAVQGGTSLGVGDLRGFRILKSILPRMIHYYLGLSVIFLALSAALPHVWSSALWYSAQYIGLILRAGASTGAPALGYQLAILLFAVTLALAQLSASKLKARLTGQSYLDEEEGQS